MQIFTSPYYRMSIVVIFMFTMPCIVISQEDTTDSSTKKLEEIRDIESQLDELKTTLYCYCGCDRMTYEICHCGTAEKVKIEFREALESGKTADEIRTAYLEQHGPQFSAIMPAEGINLLAYTMPVVILLVIGGVAFMLLRRSSNNKTVRAQLNVQISDEQQKRVEAELEKYKDQN